MYISKFYPTEDAQLEIKQSLQSSNQSVCLSTKNRYNRYLLLFQILALHTPTTETAVNVQYVHAS